MAVWLAVTAPAAPPVDVALRPPEGRGGPPVLEVVGPPPAALAWTPDALDPSVVDEAPEPVPGRTHLVVDLSEAGAAEVRAVVRAWLTARSGDTDLTVLGARTVQVGADGAEAALRDTPPAAAPAEPGPALRRAPPADRLVWISGQPRDLTGPPPEGRLDIVVRPPLDPDGRSPVPRLQAAALASGGRALIDPDPGTLTTRVAALARAGRHRTVVALMGCLPPGTTPRLQVRGRPGPGPRRGW